jgi:hypothetical protein
MAVDDNIDITRDDEVIININYDPATEITTNGAFLTGGGFGLRTRAQHQPPRARHRSRDRGRDRDRDRHRHRRRGVANAISFESIQLCWFCKVMSSSAVPKSLTSSLWLPS